MEKVIYIDPEKGPQEKTFEGEYASTNQCDFAHQLTFYTYPQPREIQLWTDNELTLIIRPYNAPKP